MDETRGIPDLASAVAGIASDPGLMERLRAAVGSARTPAPDTRDAEPDAGQQRAPEGAKTDRKRLLEALRPFLSPERRERAEMLINVMELLDSGVLDLLKRGDK